MAEAGAPSDESLDDVQRRTFARATGQTIASYPRERRLTAAQLISFLDRQAFAVVATTRPGGRPHAAISAFACVGTTFWLPTTTGAVRARNVRSHPWASVVVSEGGPGNHVVVIAEGPTEVIEAAEVPTAARVAARGEWAAQWLRVRVTRLLSYASDGALA
jgi:nitroimidazol reductase NimA-like FMN-containing flavoprotein (pyridoxamine 5'-phosphate oxidase superfamily)